MSKMNCYRPHICFRLTVYIFLLLSAVHSCQILLSVIDHGNNKSLVLIIEEHFATFLLTLIMMYFALNTFFIRWVIHNDKLIIKRFCRQDKVRGKIRRVDKKTLAGPLGYFEVYFDDLTILRITSINDEKSFIALIERNIGPVKEETVK